jgi:hypothetical protein
MGVGSIGLTVMFLLSDLVKSSCFVFYPYMFCSYYSVEISSLMFVISIIYQSRQVICSV